MIPKLFLLAISISFVLANCHDDFAPRTFEESSDNLNDFLQEQFLDKNISFNLNKKDIKNLHLKIIKDGFEYPNSYIKTKIGNFPNHIGIYKIDKLYGNLQKIHILVKEPNRLTANEAFNTANDLIGNLFYDYNIDATKLNLKPYEARVYYKDSYLGISVEVYGVKGDATEIKQTLIDISIINYSNWVDEYKKCKGKR